MRAIYRIFIEKAFSESTPLIIPTHNERIKTLKESLNKIAYGQSQHIHSIFIYWIDKNISIPPPDITEYVDLNRTKVHIEIINSPERHLTDRFKKPTNLKTRAVFSSDDDINLSPQLYDSLFEMYVSNNFRNYIFGTLQRSCINGKYLKRKTDSFNLILTGAAFLDVSMLDPKTVSLPWTDEENELLRKKVEEMGTKWKKIQQLFIMQLQHHIH